MFIINGLTINVTEISPPENLYAVSFMDFISNGYHAKSNLGVKVRFEAKTAYYDHDDALAIAQWIDGVGQVWDFESATAASQQWGSKGTGANSGSSWDVDSTYNKYGTYGIDVDGASSEYFRVDTPLATGTLGLTPDDYTIMFWRQEGTGGTQYHYAYVSDNGSATEYRNGSSGTYNITNTVSISTGAAGYVSLLGKAIADGTTNVQAFYDELIILPYAATSDMVTAVYSKGSAMSKLPLVDVKGDAVGSNGYITMLSRVTGRDYIQGNLSGSFASNVSRVSFELIPQRTV